MAICPSTREKTPMFGSPANVVVRSIRTIPVQVQPEPARPPSSWRGPGSLTAALYCPAPYHLVDTLVELDILALHVLCEVLPDVLYGAVAPLPAGHPACIPERDDINVLLHLFCHDLTPLTVLLRQLRRFGCATTERLVLTITHWGTRRFWSHAFASRIFLPLLNLLMFLHQLIALFFCR